MLKKNLKILAWSFCLALALVTCRTIAVQAAQPEQPATETQVPAVPDGLQTINGHLYFYSNGSPVKNTWALVNEKGEVTLSKSFQKAKGTEYYFGENGIAYKDRSRLVDGEYYIFESDGKLSRRYPNVDEKQEGEGGNGNHIVKINGGLKYYANKNGRAISGWNKLENAGFNVIYSGKTGKLAANKKVSYIKFKKNGYAKNKYQALAKIYARKFINKHTKSSWSRNKKLNKCFWYIYKHRHYIAHYVKDHKASTTNGWQYKAAYDMLSSKRLIGNCRNFASSIAAISKELGYKPVIYSMSKHSVVKIGSKWYDNMHGGLCGKGRRPYYNKVKKKFKF